MSMKSFAPPFPTIHSATDANLLRTVVEKEISTGASAETNRLSFLKRDECNDYCCS